MSGSRSYPLPGSNVTADIDYIIEDKRVCFDGATIDGEYLDCINNFVQREIKTRKGCMTYTSKEIVRFRQYFQDLLDEDEIDILQDYDDGMIEARADQRAGR